MSRCGPTLSTVARVAGVSVPTASKVVNGREDVAADTRQRVSEVLDRLGYVRRPLALPHAPPLVDVVVHSLESSWSGAILRGAEQAALEHGIEVVVSAGLGRTRGSRPERGWLDRVAARGTGGVLFTLAELTATQHAWLAQHDIPYVMIDPSADPPAGCLSVCASNRAGGLAATEHLIGLGHRRIGVIAGRRKRLCSRARLSGYRSALAAAGIPDRAEYVGHGGFALEGGYLNMLRLLDLPEPPTAVFVCSDHMALGAYRALAERRIGVPDGMSVVGFDDLPEATWAAPALTTIRQPLADMAATAMRLLVRVMRGERPETDPIELPTRLVERASTAPPPDGH